MSNKVSNYPAAQAAKMPTEYVTETVEKVQSLLEMGAQGIPKNTKELKDRFRKYLEFCAEKGSRPALESWCLSCGCNRTSFWSWCNGSRRHKDTEWRDTCLLIKQCLASFLEQSTIDGRLSPPVGIFLLKNWENYQDSLSLQTTRPEDEQEGLSLCDIERKLGFATNMAVSSDGHQDTDDDGVLSFPSSMESE